MDPADSGSPYTSPTVRILGPIQIDGPGSPPRGRVAEVTEAIVYLALHPNGVDVDELVLALWRRTDVAAETWRGVVSRARCWLRGHGSTDDDFLLVRGGHVTLGETVQLDWRRFDALTACAYRSGQDGIGDLRDALSLVRGPPLFGRPANRYAWLVDTFFEYEIPAAIDDAANRLATLCLQAGDWAGARDAARRGLLVDRDSERLLRAWLQAECALGNQAQARIVCGLLQRDPANLDPDTTALLDNLPIRLRRTVSHTH